MSKEKVSLQVKIQRMGNFLSGMVMPNIGVFIAWGLITALFIPTGWFPNEYLARLVGPTITYLLPALIGYTGGYNVYGKILSVHTGADQQAAGREPIEDLRVMVEHTREAGISVAGGINSKSVAKYVALNPDIIIVGSGITHNPDPAKEAAAIKAAMRKGA